MKQLDCPQCGRKCASEAALKAYVCGKCGLHAYCSEACARTHWRQHGHHNRLCLIYRVAEALLNRARQLGDESAKEYWTGVLMSVLYHYPTSRPVSMLMYTHSRDALQSNFRGLDLGHLRVVSLQALLRLGMFQQALDFQAWWRGDTHSSSSSNSNSSSMGMGVYLGVRGSDVTAPENMDECRSLPAWWIVVLLLLKYVRPSLSSSCYCPALAALYPLPLMSLPPPPPLTPILTYSSLDPHCPTARPRQGTRH